MTDSSIGWGHNPFGHHQYGFGDWAEEMLWKNVPEFYRDCDEAGPSGSAVAQPFRKFQNALKPSYQDIRIKWHLFPTLWDAIKVPIAQLPQLGYNVGIDVDPTKPEGLQRSSVLNASQLWVNKGTDKGYGLTAAFEGLLVVVTPLWAETCGPAVQELGSITDVSACSFDLSTTPIGLHPVSPGTVHVRVTTQYGIVEDIYDDENGALIGQGNQQFGPLSRLDLTPVTSAVLVSIVGLFSVGDTVVQGLATGSVIATSASRITILPTAGVFTTGAITDTTSGATAIVVSLPADVMTPGETFIGLTSGVSGVMRGFNTTYAVIDRVNSPAGFTVGETLRGQTSGSYSVAGALTPLIQGPLRARLALSSIVGSFTTGDEITGATSGSIGFIESVSSTSVDVETITQPGFEVGETISAGANTAVIDSISFGSIDYISGGMSGNTVCLELGSSIDYVVDLVTIGPDQFLPNYDDVAADDIPMDAVISDQYSKWPITYRPVKIVNGILTDGECRSHSLRLFFYAPNDTEIENFSDTAQRIINSLERFRPLHVRFDKISFDGASGASQLWLATSVVADSSATSVWCAPVVANQQSSSQVWTTGQISADVAS